MLRFTILLLIAFSVDSNLWGQEDKKIPDDEYGITYDVVFENMHYNQPLRPQVHYTPITGQIADATGLILHKGSYHLFYMYDEWSRSRRYNKSWGHAVSYDLVHWEQKPQIFNTLLDNAPGSGSGIVDWNNSLGLQTGYEKTLVVFYTDYGRGTCIAFSRDAGQTWIRHKSNPVIPMPEGKADRDAKVFWYKPDQSWRLILYEPPGFTFYKSKDLLTWTLLSKMEGFHECPDFLYMTVEGDPETKKWVIIDGDGSYRIGDFDGTSFTSEMENTRVNQGVRRESWRGADRELYATQSWSHSYEGDGPFYQMAFMHLSEAPRHDRTWSQQQTFPVALSLQNIGGKLVLCRNPINAIKQLRFDPHIYKNLTVQSDENPLQDINGDVFEIMIDVDVSQADKFGLLIRGEPLTYYSSNGRIDFMETQAYLPTIDGMVTFRFIVDRNSIEVFCNRGEVTFTKLFYPDEDNQDLEIFTDGSAHISTMEVYRLQSIWLQREQELGFYRQRK
ncbi:MAG: glycoside hydrolase family 32 protein [Saprospiraceae bacterium]|nr:glycoside hydrolase family 32 protein [Saprospiraceae bacterium]